MIDRSLGSLNPIVRSRVLDFQYLINKHKLKAEVFETYRGQRRQEELLEQGKSKAKFGHSYHNYGLAVDIVFKDNRGNWTWNSDQWERLGQIGKSLGFEWGGDWKGFVDCPHFQYTFGLSIDDLLSGKKPPIEDETHKYIDWAMSINLCNNDNWQIPPTKYEIVVMLNRLVKSLEK